MDFGILDLDVNVMNYFVDDFYFFFYCFIGFGIVIGYLFECGWGGYLLVLFEWIEELIV